MKRILYLSAALSALAMVSCQREQHPVEGRPVQITVSVRGTSPTRVISPSYEDESLVSDVQVYVFNDGVLEDYQKATGQTEIQMTATAGRRTIWALVNAPDITGITGMNELLAHASLLSDNDPEAFVMSGSVEKVLSDGDSVDITVRRLVSRVSINRIETDFKYGLPDEKLTVDAIYLINVAADNSYVEDVAPEDWINKLGHTDSGFDELLFNIVGEKVYNGHPYEVEHVFYPYPNPTEATPHDSPFTPRHTMLVIEVTFQGKKGYYPYELPVLKRNCTYTIEKMIISSRPGDLPYEPLENGEMTVRISVKPWEYGMTWNKLEL